MKRVFALALIGLAACGGNEDKAKNVEATSALRAMALTAKLPFAAADDEPIVVVTDMDFVVSGSSVVVTKEGDASVYYRNGGAVIGGGGHPHIHARALTLISEAAKHIGRMRPATSFPLPTGGNVRFYVRTPQRVYMAEAALTDLMDDKHPLAPLFGASMDVAMPLQDLGKEK